MSRMHASSLSKLVLLSVVVASWVISGAGRWNAQLFSSVWFLGFSMDNKRRWWCAARRVIREGDTPSLQLERGIACTGIPAGFRRITLLLVLQSSQLNSRCEARNQWEITLLLYINCERCVKYSPSRLIRTLEDFFALFKTCNKCGQIQVMRDVGCTWIPASFEQFYA